MFLDLAKAFDTVCHRRLLSRLYSIGMRGPVYRLFEQYLKQRKQIVRIGETDSEFRYITYGIPQGTVLGPILFIIYVNELFSLQTSGTVVSFADDTVLFVEDETWTGVENKIRCDLYKIIDWFDNSLLSVNLSKTVYVPFSNYSDKLPADDQLYIKLPFRRNNWTLSASQSVKYLGIYIDTHLRWDIQSSHLTKKLRSLFYLFKQLVNILDEANLRAVYHALVQTHLEYGIVGWGGAYDANIMPAIIAHKAVIKIMYNLPFQYPTTLLYKNTRLLCLRKIFYKKALLYSIKHKLIKDNVKHNYGTRFRENENIILPKMQKSIGRQTYTYIGQKMYNTIPQALKSKTEFRHFGSLLNKYLIANELDLFQSVC